MKPRRAAASPALALLLIGIAASHASASPLGLTDCGPAEGVFACQGIVKTWDGVPLDVTVVLPRQGARKLPLVTEINGFGNSKYEYLDPASTAYTGNAYSWAKRGYAALAYTARGQWGSCGTPEARLANAADCVSGYLHLADTRYEVRDAQTLIGKLVDDGTAARRRIGVTGDSYGGGQSLALASLRDRVMLPSGKLVRWRSPKGIPLRVAAAAPVIPWSDLITAAAPNGRVLPYALTPRRVATVPVGVEKASFVNAIFAAAQTATGPGQPIGEPFVPGRPMGFIAPLGLDPQADVEHWVARTDVGEPYDDADAKGVVDTLARYHSAYYIDARRRPPPMLLASGFTDDLFPVDHALRYANRTLARHPHARISLLLGDFGHQRAANVPVERKRLIKAIAALFNRFLRGRGRAPRPGARAYIGACPRGTTAGHSIRASSFDRLARGQIRLRSKPVQAVSSSGGDPTVGTAIDPVAGGGDACATTTASDAPGTAVYKLHAAPKRGWTLIGSPLVRSTMDLGGAAEGTPQIAARLWDVAPGGGEQTLVTRGLWRPAEGANLLALFPASWKFKAGHTPRLELAGADAPYARPSNGNFSIDVSNLRLRLPVRQRPDCKRVRPIRTHPLIRGTRLAPGASRSHARRCHRR